MTLSALGIRAKLNLGLSVLLLGMTAAFGVTYALVERGTVLEIEREHLRHMASLARLYLADVRDRGELEVVVDEFNSKLTSSRGRPHRLTVEDDQGVVLATSGPGRGSVRSGQAPQGSGEPPPVEMHPAQLLVHLPLRLEGYGSGSETRQPARLVLYSSLPRLQEMFRTSLLRHFGFGAGLVALAILAGGIMTHILVVRPVQELVAATDRIAKDGDWGTVAPSERRRDEIGVLGDHLAAMSRRLVEAVRAERYGSAHMVATRVNRELEKPLRRAEMQLTVLESILPSGSDADRVRAEIAAELEELGQVARRLDGLPGNPPA